LGKIDVEVNDLLDIKEIMKRLPHRYPFLLVDRVLELEEGRIVAIKNVSVNEPFFQGHYPGRPIMPGVLVIEAMAQAGGLAVAAQMDTTTSVPLLAGVDKARFKKVVEPGDQLRIEVKVEKVKGGIGKINAVCTVDGELVCQAELLFAIRSMV
jgi:3-hydroxyacyl-[acyl-carrier-protein] dehydratase